MKRNIFQKATRLSAQAYTVELLLSHGNSRSLTTAKRIVEEMERDCLRLTATISLVFARHDAAKEGTKKKGKSYERKGPEAIYRCWSCKFFGDLDTCINLFLDRPACRLYRTNQILKKHDSRIKAVRKGKSGKIPCLKVPKIKTYSEHIQDCRVCDRFYKKRSKRARLTPNEKSSKHYRRYLNRRRKKVAAFFAYYGIRFRDDYIFGWEE